MSETQSTGAVASEAPQATSEASESEGQEAPATQEAAPAEAASAPKTQAEKKAEAKMLKKLKLKIDKGEVEEELPFEIPDDPKAIEYMTKQLQMSKVAQKRMQESAQLQHQVQSFIEELRKNPRKVLSDPSIGVDIKQFAAAIIEEEIANAQKSPEQLEREKLENELRAMKEEREREKMEMQAKELERLQGQEIERIDMQMEKALSSTDLPKSPYVVKKIANYLLLGLQEDMKLDVNDVIPLVREEILEDVKQMFGAMPDEVIESVVGKEVFNRIRKKNVSKAKTPPPTPLNAAVKDVGVKSEPKPTGKKTSFKEFFGI